MAAALADHLGHRLLGAAEPVDQRLVAEGLLHRVQVGALDVFDDGDLQHVEVVQLAHQHRHRVQPGALGRAPAPLARNDLILARSAGGGPHQDRLQHALLADRRGQLLQLGFAEAAARLVRIAAEKLDRHLLGRPRGRDGRGRALRRRRLGLSQQG